jgi:hypothetical protein
MMADSPYIATETLAALFGTGIDELISNLPEEEQARVESAELGDAGFAYSRSAVIDTCIARRIPFAFESGGKPVRIEVVSRSTQGDYDVFICLAAFPGCCEGAQIYEIWIRHDGSGDLLRAVELISDPNVVSAIQGPSRFYLEKGVLSFEDLMPEFEM